MPVTRSIRIQMPDRPGALSTIGAVLAAHGVDIVRLDVVSHDAGLVVDDLLLSANDGARIDAAAASFPEEVEVHAFSAPMGDPALELALALATAGAQQSADDVRSVVIEHATILGRADIAALLRHEADGRTVPLAGPPGLPVISPGEPFIGRTASARAVPIGEPWAPAAFTRAFGPYASIALAPCGQDDLLVLGREQPIVFFAGELDRIAAFGRAIGAMIALHDRAAVPGAALAGT